jgi:hypothetical protein
MSQRVSMSFAAFPDRAVDVVSGRIRAVARPRQAGAPGDWFVVPVLRVPYVITAAEPHPLREACAIYFAQCGFASPQAMESGMLDRYPSLRGRQRPEVWIHMIQMPAEPRWWVWPGGIPKEAVRGACG